jgi:hypothetical protein
LFQIWDWRYKIVSIVAEEGFKLYPKQVVIATGKGFAPLSFPKL